MSQTSEISTEIKNLEKEINRLNMVDIPGMVLLGLGLYGVFGAKGDAFIAALNNQAVAYGTIAIGLAVVGHTLWRLIPLLLRHARLKEQLKQESNQQSR